MTYGSQTWTMTIKEMNTLRIFERKIYEIVRGRTLENKNKQGDKGHITRAGYCKIYKIPPLKKVWSS
jgi:hypothetical protein